MILIRHAQSEWNRYFGETRIDPDIPDPVLTDLGRQQAEALAEELSGYTLNALVASPYKRTLETAKILASALELPIMINTLVRERCVFSCDIGSNPVVLKDYCPDIDFSGLEDGWWGEPPESETSIIERCRQFRANHGDLLARDDIAVISHWGFIRAFTGEEVDNAAIVEVSPDASGLSPAD
ncbi:MAG: histidine phosphatase family protein [Pseudomonadota bacterium]